jgi:CDP-glucose 4,6-dehydratase
MEDLDLSGSFAGRFRGHRIFVTGHTGFTGSWLSQWLIDLGAHVTGYAQEPSTTPALFDLAGLAAHMDHHLGDIADRDHLAAVLEAARPRSIVHLAAQPIVAEAYRDPFGTMMTNAMGTAALLETIRSRPWPELQTVLVVTTDKVYGDDHGGRPLQETDPLGSADPYSTSKAMAELVVGSYARIFSSAPATRHVRLASVRAGNIFGGGDWSAFRLVPDCVCAILSGAPIRLRCPSSVRPWQFVLEPIAGYLALLAADDLPASHEAWNLGPSDAASRTVEFVARALVAIAGQREACPIVIDPAPWKETALLALDSTKARNRLGWETILPIEDGLRWTFEFYDAIRRGLDPNGVQALMRRQIHAYSQRARQHGLAWFHGLPTHQS